MEEYIRTTLKRAKELHQKSQMITGSQESKTWQRNAQFALDSALRLSLINMKINPAGFIVNFNDNVPEGNEIFVNGVTLNTGIEGLYNLPEERLQSLANGGDLLMDDDVELKK